MFELGIGTLEIFTINTISIFPYQYNTFTISLTIVPVS